MHLAGDKATIVAHYLLYAVDATVRSVDQEPVRIGIAGATGMALDQPHCSTVLSRSAAVIVRGAQR